MEGRRGTRLATEEPLVPASLVALLHLAAACGFGVAQPLYDLLGPRPAFFVAHHLGWLDALLLSLLLSIGLPATLWAAVAAAGWLSPVAARWLLGGWVGLALASMPLQALRRWPDGVTPRLLLLVLLAIALAAAYLRWDRLRRSLALLSAGALVFPILFVTKPGVRGLGRRADPVSAVEIERPVSIVMLVFDELPMTSLLNHEGSIDGERFPNFARLRAVCGWFRRATTVAHNTAHALPAMLTGRYPEGGPRPPNRRGHPENLFAVLEGSLNLNVLEYITDLCGESCDDSRAVRTRRERWLPALTDIGAIYSALVLADAGPTLGDGWSGFWRRSLLLPADARRDHLESHDPPRRYARFERRLATFPDRTLHYLHLKLPHVPWQFVPSGSVYATEGRFPHGLRNGQWWSGTEWEVVQAQQRHLLQTQYADTLLGRLLDELDRLRRFDESLIIVTADHGAAFRRGEPRRAATPTNVIDVSHVPLLVKLPGQRRARTDDRNVQTIDILPTIADVLDFAIPWRVDGVSLLSSAPRSPEKRVYRGTKKVGAGEVLAFSSARVEEWREAVETAAGRFPESDLFVVGPEPRDRALLGRPAAPRSTSMARARADLRGSEELHDIALGDARLADRFVPSHVMGTLKLEETVSTQVRIAVVLDGVVRAVTETYGPMPAASLDFTALLDPALFDEGGRPWLELFVISGEGEDRVFEPVALAGASDDD